MLRPAALLAVLLGTAPALAAGPSPHAEAGEGARPNVLMIAIDDLNDWIGCMGGHPQARTPNIDRLAAAGTLFTNAHCQAPICGPSRASLMTGLRPSTTGFYLQIGLDGIRSSGGEARSGGLLHDNFERHGYRSMGTGKIFHDGNGDDAFDEYGVPKSMGPKPKRRFNYDPAWFEDRTGGTQTDWAAYPDKDSMMPDHQSATWAAERLGRESEEPFFLAVGFCRPHVPFYAPQKWFDMHPLEGIETPPYDPADLDDVPAIGRRVAEAPMMPTTEWAIESGEWPEIVQAYLACTTFVDHQVGRVLTALENGPHAGNTIVVLWTDHGYHLGEKNRFAKQAIWEEATHVNLMIAGPGLPAGGRCDAPVELLDVYPTLTSLAGLPANPRNEGDDLTPLLRDPSAAWPHAAVTTYGPGNHAVRTRDFRYIRYEDGSEELYDRRVDPLERTNLAGELEHAATKTRLAKFLPESEAPLAEASKSNFNEYFRERMPAWRER